MSTTTTRLVLYKPAISGENVNVLTDINNNLDNIDSKMPAVNCTSGARPGTPYAGEIIFETDTGRTYVWQASATAWRQIPTENATFNTNMLYVSGKRIGIGVASPANTLHSMDTSATNILLRAEITGDTVGRWTVDHAGKQLWGAGGASAGDVNLYRSAADLLKTDDKFEAAGGVNISGGNLQIGTAFYRNKLSAVTTVASTASETVIGTLTIPANDMIIGATYRLRCRGTASVTGTPTLTLRSRISGVGGTAIASSGTITASSGVTLKPWEVDLIISCVTTGASGTIRGIQIVVQSVSVAGAAPSAPASVIDGGGTAITVDTTVSRDLVVTAQWGTSSASNTLTAYIVSCERLA